MNSGRVRSAAICGSKAARQRLVLEPLESRLLLSVTIFSETFESGSLATNGWTVEDSNPAGTPAYWNAKASTFGGEEPHGGNWKGYCAGFGYGGDDNNPTYQNDMNACMSRDIDLTNYVSATLTFWHKMPSLDAAWDAGLVWIDGSVVGGAHAPQVEWVQQTSNLDAFVGGVHTLLFQFRSDSSTTAEGWYIDDILVTGEEDPDDTISEAVSLGAVSGTVTPAPGQSLNSNIDVDMYSFTVAAGQRVAFDVDRPAAGPLYDSVLRLFDATGTQLAANDNQYGPAPESNNLEAYLEYTFATPGTYYIGVSGGANQSYNPLTGAGDVADGVGAYDLALIGMPHEFGDTIGQAAVLGNIAPGDPPSIMTESLGPATDVDMYSFTVAANQRLGFDTDRQSVWAPNTYLRLFDAAGTQLASNDDGTGPNPDGGWVSGESYIEYTFDTAGTYYVGVSGAPNSGYDPLTGTGDVNGDMGWYDLIVRDLGRYVGRIAWVGGAKVDVYDCDEINDIILDDVAVVFKAPNVISSITLVGAQNKSGLGIVVSGADSVGKVSDKRSLPSDLAFFVCDKPVASLALRSGIAGFNINGMMVGGIGPFPSDIDNDGDTADRTALHVQGSIAKLSLTGNLDGDAIIQGDLPSVKITGSIAADVRVTGSIPKPSVSGNWAGAIEANTIGSPKITGTLSGTMTVPGVDAKGVSIGKLSAGQIGDLTVTANGGVSSIAAASWADGSLRAAWLGSLSAKGTKTAPGDFGADLTLFGSAGITTLGKVSISGTLQDAAWSVSGVVSSLTVGRWGAGSILAVGVDPGGDGTYFTGDDWAPLPVGTISKGSIAAYDTAHGSDFGILAALFGSGKVGGISPVLPFADGQFRIVQVV